VHFVKGHGTRNDFVVLPDLDDALDLDAQTVRALCDRRGGIGADGVLRVVRRNDASARWFMDYRNADGSIAEMCGNGIRVVARWLVDSGHEPAGEFGVHTRDGVKTVTVPTAGDVTVGMGRAERLPDAKVGLNGQWWPATGWSMGNPHLVVLDAEVAALDLTDPPSIDPASSFPDGANIEFVETVAPDHIRMRVHERGVGETQSCGTGACAAAVAAMAHQGQSSGTYVVDVPGGRLSVAWLPDGTVTLTGPAIIVAEGEYRGDASPECVSPSG
jgi:diaminopimelate epimerase